MNKLFSKIAALSVGLALAIGVGVSLRNNSAVAAKATEVTDVLNRATTGQTGTSYGNWSGKKSNSNAVYAGNSAGGNSSIQLRSNNSNSGIITTTSGGKVKSVTVSWNSNTTNGAKLNIYGKNTAYSAASDLYDNSKQGTKLGDITKNTSTSLPISGDYEYIGLRSNSGAMYLNSITIVWDAPSETCTVSFNTGGGSSISSQTVAKGGKATVPTSDPTKTNYEFDGWYTDNTYSTLFDFANTTINEDTVIYANWVSASTYNKVTSSLADWSGTYLLVYEADSSTGYIWTGVDDTSCYASHTITSSSLKRDNGGASVTIASMEGGYSILINDGANKGKYIGGLSADSNGIQFSDSAVVNSISYSNSNIVIDSNSKHLTFNNTDGQKRFRYFKNANAAIQLYKKSVPCIIQYDANGGTGTMSNSDTVVSACTFTAPSGKEFDHWNTKDDDTGTPYNPNASVTSSCTLYAIWRDLTPSVSLDKDAATLTTGGSSTTVTATTTNITSPTYSWSNTSGDDCVTLTNATTATVTIAPKGTAFASCTVTLTVNGSLGGKAITPIQKTVAITVDKVPTQDNPYTVAEAIYAIDNSKTTTNVYVTGIVSQVDSISSGAINYYISDDGTTTDQFYVYKGKDSGGASFSNLSDVLVGDVVVVKGSITLYNSSVYEFTSGSQRVSYSRVVVSSISVKTAPSKTAYVSGSDFDPTGLVITVTYSNEDTEDVAYNDSTKASFSFDKQKITEAGNVTITYAGQTCTQAVTILTVKNVTGVESAPTEVYQGDPISASSVTLNVLYSDDTTVGTVTADSVSVDTSAVATHVAATATYNGASGTKTATFYVDVIKKPVWDYVDDVINNAKTVSYLGTTSTTSWAENFTIDYSSGSRYTVHSMGTNNTSNALQFNKNGYLYADRTAGFVYSITIKGTNTNKINVFASNSAYLGEPTGEYVEQLTLNGSTGVTYTFEDDYTYLALHGVTAGTAIESITIRWKVEGAEYPLTENPTISPSGSASVSVGRNLSITVTSAVSGEHDSDERLIISTSDATKVSVSGSGRAFVVRGLVETSSPVTVTIGGIKGQYSTSISITVTEAVKTYDDKILTQSELGITSYDEDTSHDYVSDNVAYTCYDVMNTNGIQFKDGVGYIANKEVLYSGTHKDIKSITLIMDGGNKGYITAYEGTAANPSSDTATLVGTWSNTGVNTYQFSDGMTYFKLKATGTTNVRKIIIELEDDADDVLSEARSAALAILTDLSGSCGEGSGTVSQFAWNTLVSDLTELNLSNSAKNYLKNVERIALDNLSQGGAELENAMAHYDACIEKFGFEDVFGISQAESQRYNPINILVSKGSTSIIIVIVSVAISGIAIGGYFFFRKKKEN